MRRSFLIVLLVVLAAGTVWAQGPTMAAQVNAFGLVNGSYAGNFEYLLADRHGVVGEVGYQAVEGSSGFLAAAHYRFHFSPQLDSWFIAPFFKFRTYNGGTVTESSVEYEFDATALTYGVNLGRRWIFGPGISVVFRLGYGPTTVNTTYTGAEPSSTDLVEDLLGFFLGFDGELSIGYAF